MVPGYDIWLLGEFYAAYDHLQEAYQLYNSLLPGDRELQAPIETPKHGSISNYH
jgi:hypothetical protein